MMKRSFAAAAIWLAASAPAWAQAGQFPAGYVQGNAGASAGQGSPSAVTAILDRALGATRGAIIERGSSGWALVGPGSVAGLPWVSNGTGTDPAYQILGVVGGGTGSGTASGAWGNIVQTPSTSSLGGVKSYTAPSHQWLNAISTAGQPGSTQPGFGDLTGTATLAQGGLGGSQAAATANQIPVFPGSGGAAVPTTPGFALLTGNISTSQMNSGTGASTSTYWRGDGTWAAPPGTGTVTSAAVAGGGGETTSGTCSSTTSLNCVVLSPGGHLNKFRNAGFQVNQRGPTPVITSNGNYGSDGWQVSFAGSTSVQVVSSGGCCSTAGAPVLEIAGASGNTSLQIFQRIESYVAAALRSQTVTLQFQFYQDTGSTITPSFATCYASATDNFSTCTSDVSAGLTACGSNSWCTESYTFNVSANASNGYQIALNCNSGFTASQHCYFAGPDIRVTPGVATGLNSNPPPPELRNIAEETVFCQRYLNTSYPAGNAPGAATTGGMVQVGFSISGGLISAANVRFPTTMRAAPTLTFWDSAGNSGKISDTPSNSGAFTNNLTNASSGAFNISANGFSFIASIASTTANYWAHYVASAEL